MTTFKAIYDGQEFTRNSDEREYTYVVIARYPIQGAAPNHGPKIVWKAVSWARTHALALKKAHEYRNTYLEYLAIPAYAQDPEPKAQASRPTIEKVPAPKCRRCGDILTGAESLERGYGDKCWRKHRAEERALEIAQGRPEALAEILAGVTVYGPAADLDFLKVSLEAWDEAQEAQDQDEQQAEIRQALEEAGFIVHGPRPPEDDEHGLTFEQAKKLDDIERKIEKALEEHDALIKAEFEALEAAAALEGTGFNAAGLIGALAPGLEEAEQQAEEMAQAREEADRDRAEAQDAEEEAAMIKLDPKNAHYKEVPKRKPGRPRLHPAKDPNAPKPKRGRPKKASSQAPEKEEEEHGNPGI